MCGRVIQSSGPLRLAIVEGPDVSDSRTRKVPPRYNAAPSQELLVIRENHRTGKRSLDLIKWGLIPHGPRPYRRPQAPGFEAMSAGSRKVVGSDLPLRVLGLLKNGRD